MMTKQNKIMLIYTSIWAAILVTCLWSGFQLSVKLTANKKLLETTEGQLFAAQQNLGIEMKKNLELNEKLDLMGDDLNEANTTIADLKSVEYELVYLGGFKITHYCTELWEHICGEGQGITASGTRVTAGRTVAVDPKVIPYGTQLYIEGYGWRIAEDCGGAVKNAQIDVAVETHADALAMGVKSGGVWMLVKRGS